MIPEPSSHPPADAAAVRNWMVSYISSVIEVPADPFPVDDRFDHYGLDSVEITIMCGMMEEHFGIEVNPTEVFDHPSVAMLALHLAERIRSIPALA